MIEDKERWNKKYATAPMPGDPIEALTLRIDMLTEGSKALDIACGKGRHAHYLASKKIYVDAVDYSDVALEALDKSEYIQALDTDLDHYTIEANTYDLIICTNYLSRRLFPFMKEGLKEKGLLMVETFVVFPNKNGHQSTNIEYLLRKNELLHAFIGLDILFYEEKELINLHGENVKKATLVAQR